MSKKDLFGISAQETMQEYAQEHTHKPTQEHTQVYEQAAESIDFNEYKSLIGRRRELKDRRVSLLTFPSLLEKIKQIACVNNLTVNEAINAAMQEYTENHSADLAAYNKLKEGK